MSWRKNYENLKTKKLLLGLHKSYLNADKDLFIITHNRWQTIPAVICSGEETTDNTIYAIQEIQDEKYTKAFERQQETYSLLQYMAVNTRLDWEMRRNADQRSNRLNGVRRFDIRRIACKIPKFQRQPFLCLNL